MKWRIIFLTVLVAIGTFVVFLRCQTVFAENIDPYNDDSQYAYGENIGWLNAEPLGDGGPGVAVNDTKLTGHLWGENIGWVSLSCENTGSCGTVNYGVTNDGGGNLSGYTWGENVGWISFSCENNNSCGTVDYGVTIDPATGEFNGHAWGENIGWITFRSTAPTPFGVMTSWPETMSVPMNLPAGWSMISLPVDPTDKKLKTLFPGAAVVYGYEKGTGYIRVGDDDDLAVGKGYWILLNQDASYTLTGDRIPSYAHTASSDGWAMIGGCTDPAQVIPEGCDIGVIYGYAQGTGYQRVTEHLEQGKGYWILLNNVDGGGTISVETDH
jgi:hypothetical protein